MVMIFCFIILAFMVILTVVSTLNNLDKVIAVTLIALLAIGIPFAAAFREEKGKATALREVGYTPYTKTELCEMSEAEKDKLPKTYDDWEGTIYWRIDAK